LAVGRAVEGRPEGDEPGRERDRDEADLETPRRVHHREHRDERPERDETARDDAPEIVRAAMERVGPRDAEGDDDQRVSARRGHLPSLTFSCFALAASFMLSAALVDASS